LPTPHANRCRIPSLRRRYRRRKRAKIRFEVTTDPLATRGYLLEASDRPAGEGDGYRHRPRWSRAPRTGITIARPPEQVFDYIADARHQRRWNPVCKAMEQTTPVPVAVPAERDTQAYTSASSWRARGGS